MTDIDRNRRAREGAECCCCYCLTLLVILLIVILVPMSFSYVEYYEYGIKQRRSTGSVDLSRVYSNGRYALGPDYRFIKYQADAHWVTFEELSVFSDSGSNESIGLEFLVDADFTYFLKQDEIANLHRELASSYQSVIESRAKDAIKNEAIYVKFTEYFRQRKNVERRFRKAVQTRWDADPPLHCTLDQFHLGRIRIPQSVAEKQLQSRVQNERNKMEEFNQKAQLERETTSVQVNKIQLNKTKTLRTAQAEASLIRSKARSDADRLEAQAQTNGTTVLFSSASIVTQDHKTAFTYIRTLKNRNNVDIDVSYLSAENILRTRPV